MSDVLIIIIRDLGTALKNVTVLNIAKCGLTDLEGIGAFPR